MKRRRKKPEYFPCPHCGTAIETNARSCRECGSDDLSGWSDEDITDIPESQLDDAEYDEFLRSEGLKAPEGRPRSKASGMNRRAVWFLVAAGLALAGMILSLLFR